MRLAWIFVPLTLVAIAGLAGCASGEAGTVKTPPVSNEARIKAIQDTPGMPEDQKAAAIARLNSQPVIKGPK